MNPVFATTSGSSLGWVLGRSSFPSPNFRLIPQKLIPETKIALVESSRMVLAQKESFLVSNNNQRS